MIGYGFRRQHPLGNYILDFYCHQAKLAIELDGGQHGEESQHAHDDQRSNWLRSQGITVLRFWNNEVLTNTEGVLQSLFDTLSEQSSTNVPGAPSPTPPPVGEGLNPQALAERSLSLRGITSDLAALPPSRMASSSIRVGEGAHFGERAGEGAPFAEPVQPATYEQIHKALLCGLLGNIGTKSVESNEYLGARGIKFFIAPNSVLAKKGSEMGDGGRDRRDAPAVCALRGAHRAGMAGGSRRAPDQAALLRPALGKEGGAGGGVRAQHAVRPASSTRRSACTTGR